MRQLGAWGIPRVANSPPPPPQNFPRGTNLCTKIPPPLYDQTAATLLPMHTGTCMCGASLPPPLPCRSNGMSALTVLAPMSAIPGVEVGHCDIVPCALFCQCNNDALGVQVHAAHARRADFSSGQSHRPREGRGGLAETPARRFSDCCPEPTASASPICGMTSFGYRLIALAARVIVMGSS